MAIKVDIVSAGRLICGRKQLPSVGQGGKSWLSCEDAASASGGKMMMNGVGEGGQSKHLAGFSTSIWH